MQQPALVRAVEKLAEAGRQAGFSESNESFADVVQLSLETGAFPVQLMK